MAECDPGGHPSPGPIRPPMCKPVQAGLKKRLLDFAYHAEDAAHRMLAALAGSTEPARCEPLPEDPASRRARPIHQIFHQRISLLAGPSARQGVPGRTACRAAR